MTAFSYRLHFYYTTAFSSHVFFTCIFDLENKKNKFSELESAKLIFFIQPKGYELIRLIS